jgi:hypothetical protein
MCDFHHPLVFKSVATSGKYIASMAKNSAAHEKKVKHAMQVLLENPRLKVCQAMLVALFGKKDLDDLNIQ